MQRNELPFSPAQFRANTYPERHNHRNTYSAVFIAEYEANGNRKQIFRYATHCGNVDFTGQGYEQTMEEDELPTTTHLEMRTQNLNAILRGYPQNTGYL